MGYTGCRGLLLLVVSGETLALAKLNKWMGKQKTLADNQRFFVNINCATLGSLKRLFKRGDHGILFCFAQAEIQRQGDGAGVVGFGGGEVALLKAEALAVIGLGVHGDVVHVYADAVASQVVKDLPARFAAFRLHIFRLYLDGVEMQGGEVVGMAVG